MNKAMSYIAAVADVEGTSLPIVAGWINAVLLPWPYWTWWACGMAAIGVPYFVARRKRFEHPAPYAVTALLMLAAAAVLLLALKW
jgi:hypothetical protein